MIYNLSYLYKSFKITNSQIRFVFLLYRIFVDTNFNYSIQHYKALFYMQNAIFSIPLPKNEPVLEYRAGSPEREALKKAIKEMRNQEMDIPMVIGGERVRTENKKRLSPPHDHKHTLGYFHHGDKGHENKPFVQL